MPKRACSGPDDEVLFDRIALIGLNSAWYLSDWTKQSEVSEGCEYKDRNDFLAAAADEIKSYRDQVKIVMLHHPLESRGNRGGAFSLSQHLFPLADVIPGAYLPLPGVGTLVRGLQSAGGGRQDLSSLRYKEMLAQLKARTEDEQNIIFVSGHEHGMFYADRDNYQLVTAGSGSRRGPQLKAAGVEFSYGAVGYARLD
ncbi:MAG: hypothetical protein HC821_02105, partial [Lewinella sp.]|nr:hypothetical protein [Lewinella sp.]